jgi:NCS1 family nucleobase:cation symporter-1
VAIQIPFMNSSLYVGPIADLMGGAEIAWLIGLVVAGGIYYFSSRAVRAQTADAVRADHSPTHSTQNPAPAAVALEETQ